MASFCCEQPDGATRYAASNRVLAFPDLGSFRNIDVLESSGYFHRHRCGNVFTLSLPLQAFQLVHGAEQLIQRVSSSLVLSIQFFLGDSREVNWNVSPTNAESF